MNRAGNLAASVAAQPYAWRPMPRPVSPAIFGRGAPLFAGLLLQVIEHKR
jgi:hypothetical protein